MVIKSILKYQMFSFQFRQDFKVINAKPDFQLAGRVVKAEGQKIAYFQLSVDFAPKAKHRKAHSTIKYFWWGRSQPASCDSDQLLLIGW